MKKLLFSICILGFIAAATLTTGCASNSAGSYPVSSARTSIQVRYGEVVSVRPVEIEGEPTFVGRFGGAWIGYALGRGNSSLFVPTHTVETAVGGVAGSIAGEAIERRARSEDALQIVVRLNSDETIAVVQSADIPLLPGDPVQVLFGSDGSTRVQPM